MNVPQNICPNCKENNEPEAVICKYCGTALESPFMDPGVKTKTTDMSVPESNKEWSVNQATIPAKGIAVYIEGELNPVYLDSKGEFIIGRSAGAITSATEDFLDLSPMGGYARGISRRHVVIRRAESGYELMDLGSVNGTWLNEARLVPHKYHPIASGAHLRLGSMRLVVLYRPVAETKQES